MKSAMTIVVLMGLVSIGAALKCYTCNSHVNKDCSELPESSRDKYLKDCNADGNSAHNFTLCRKMHMFIDQDVGEHTSEDRVHRACGYIAEDEKKQGECYYKSGSKTRTWTCTCDYDQCNSGPLSFTASATVAVFVPAAALFLSYLRSGAHF